MARGGFEPIGTAQINDCIDDSPEASDMDFLLAALQRLVLTSTLK